MHYKEFFKDKKITVMGLGLLGRGVGDVAFLAECGAKLIVTDLKTKEQLKESLEKLRKFKRKFGVSIKSDSINDSLKLPLISKCGSSLYPSIKNMVNLIIYQNNFSICPHKSKVNQKRQGVKLNHLRGGLD